MTLRRFLFVWTFCATLSAQVPQIQTPQIQAPPAPDLLEMMRKAQQLKLQQLEIERRQKELATQGTTDVDRQAAEIGRAWDAAAAARNRTSQSQNLLVPSLAVLIRPETYTSSGLRKLSGDELATLDGWFSGFLNDYALNLTQAYIGAGLLSFSSDEPIVSKIDGDSHGWDGETVFKLDNGQLWKQSAFGYSYHTSYRPTVVIFRNGGKYQMKVDDVDELLVVTRLK